MKRSILFLFLVLFFNQVSAQTFTGTGGAIPDNGTSFTCFTQTVTGVGTLSGSNGLVSVCVNISHGWDSDLSFYLQAPDGSRVGLSIGNGGSGDNYTNTCFSMSATTNITAGSPPFTGSYKPEGGNLGYLNNGSSANGTWSLCIIDDASGSAGTLNSWSLTFGSGAPTPPAGCGNNPMAGDQCGTAVAICDLNGYCGNTSAFYDATSWSNLTTAHCGSIENNSFLTFVAAASTVNLNVTVSNCTVGDGIQFLIFSTSGACSGTVTTYGCDGNMNPGVNTVTATGLTPGGTYYLMIDGYAGDVCDYSVQATGGIQTFSLTSSAGESDGSGGYNLCNGSSTTLGVTTIGAGPFTYSWSNGATSLGTGSSITVSPSVSTTYTCVVTGACGSTKTATLTINPITPITGTISASSASICTATNVTVTYTGSAPSTAAYTWDFGTGSTIVSGTGQGPYVVSYSSSGTKNITLSVKNGPCTATGNATVTVGTPVTATFTPSVTSVCSGDNLTVTYSGNATSGATYSWNFGAGSSVVSGSGQGPYVVTYSTSGTKTISLSVTEGPCSASSNSTVTVVDASGSISGVATSYCVSSTSPVTLTGTPSGGTFSGTGVSGSTFTPSVAGVGTQTITYTYPVTTTYSTTGNLTLFSDDFSTDKGWTGYVASQWERKSATASSTCTGNQDPSADHTATADNFVLGYNVGGCVQNSITTARYITSPTIDCSGKTGCSLSFWRFAGSETSAYDYLYIDVFNGTSWVNIYTNPSTSFSDAAWTQLTYNISAYADNNANFKVRFGVKTDGSTIYMGWNIDDLTVTGNGTVVNTTTTCTKSVTRNVTVNALPNITASASAGTICTTNSTTLTASNGSSYSWTPSTGLSATTGATVTANPSATTTYTVTGTDANSCSKTATVTLTVNAALTAGIIGASQNVCYSTGDPAAITFTTAPSGGNASYSYQWQSSPDGSTWSNIAGATGTSHDPAAGITSTVYIRCVVNDGCGGTVNTSAITITPYAQITGGTVAASQTICSGTIPSTLTSTTSASGGTGTTTYQWQSSTDNTNWTNITSATGTTYSPGALTVTTYFRRVATNSCGSANSNTIIITVNPLPSVTTVNKTDVSICGGADGQIAITATGTPTLNYSINGGTTFQASNSFTTLSQGTYTIIVKDGNNCTYSWGTQSISNGSAPPAPTATVATSYNLCNGASMPAFAVSDAGYTYTWWSNAALTTQVGTGLTYTPSSPSAGASATYYVTATSSGCKSTGTSFTVNVYSNVSSGTIGSNQTICSGADPSVLSELTPASGGNTGAGYTYSWEQSTNGGSTWSAVVGATSTTFDPPVLTQTTLYRRVVINACGNAVTSSVTITVNPNPNVAAISNVSVCPGSPIAASSFSSSVGGATFSWTADANYANVGLTAQSGSGNIGAYTAPANNGLVNQVSTITVSATAAGCTGTTSTYTITIKPTPTVNTLSDITVCPGENITVGTFTSTPAGGSYSWTNSNTAIGLAASGNTQINTWAATANNSGSAVSGTISYTTTLNSCVSPTKSIIVTIKPTPALSSISAISVCPGATITIPAFTSTPSGATVNWTNSNASIGLATSGSGDINPWTAPTNVSGASYTGIISATPTFNGCVGTALPISVTVKPTPVIDPINDISVCPGATVSVPAFASSPTGTYAWTNNNTAIGLAASGTGNISSYSAPTNTTGGTVNGIVSVVATANGCISANRDFIIGIYPTPSISPITDVFACPASNVSIPAFVSTPSGSTFNWTNTNTGIGLAASGSGNIADFISTANNTSINNTGNIVLTATNNGCNSTPLSFNISIRPKPQVSQIPDQSVCPGATVTVPNFTTSPSGASFNWTNTYTPIGLGASGSGNIAPFVTFGNSSGVNAVGTIGVQGTLNGCLSDSMYFTITVKPTPISDHLSDLSACPGSVLGPIAFTSTPSGSTFNWTNSNTLIGVSGFGTGDIALWTATNNNSGTNYEGYISYTPTLNGCVGLKDSLKVTVITNDNPTVVYPSLTVCSTGSNPIPSSIAQPGGTFSISGGATINSSTGEVDLGTTTSNTSYTITYTTNGTCPISRNYTLNIQASSLNADFLYPTAVCQNGGNVLPTYTGGSAGSFTVTNVISGGPLTFANSSTGEIDVANSGIGTYIVTNLIPASGGCSSASDTAIITIKSVPNAGFTALSPAYCEDNTAITLTPNTAGGVFSGSGVSGVVFNPANANIGNNNIKYVVTVNGCTDSTSQNVVVNSLPAVNGAASKDSICIGETVTLTGSNALTYAWNNGVTNAVSFAPVGTLNYILTGTDGNGCQNRDTVKVIVHNLPNVTANNAAVCRGDAAVLTANGANTYVWNTSETTQSITAAPSNTVDYYVTGTDLNGCVNSDTVRVTVNPLPSLVVTNYPSNICSGTTASIAVDGATSYSWNTGSLLDSIVVSPVITTSYTVIGTLGSCKDTTTTTINVTQTPTVFVNNKLHLDTAICTGASLTISGSGATTYSWSDGSSSNSITVTPVGNTVLTLQGNNGTCSDTAIVNIVLNPPLNLSVTNATVCQGDQAILVASGAVTYTWVNGTYNDTLPVTIFAPGTYPYTLTGVDANNCNATGTGTVTVNPRPSVLASDTTVCEGSSATIIAGGAVTYSWNIGSVNPQITVTPASSTSYTVWGTNTFNCKDSTIVNVNVLSQPIALINGVQHWTESVCENSNVTLTASGAFTYSWSTGSTQNPYTSVVANSEIITLTATAANGCKDTALAIISTNSPPVITVNSVGVCDGNSATLTANGGVSYQWSNGTLSNPLIVTPNVSSTYTVEGTDVNGCKNTAVSTVTVLPKPVIFATGATICKGSSALIFASGNATSYTWDNGLGVGQSFSVSPSNSVVYTVTATDANNCSATDTAIVSIKSVATITAAGSATDAICGLSNGSLSGASAVNATAYQWLDANGTVVSTQLNPTGLGSGTYTFVAISPDQCATNATSTVTISNTPTAQASFTISDTAGVVPFEVQFTNTSVAPAGINIVNYWWDFGDEEHTTTNVKDPNFIYYYGDRTDTVTLVITDNNGCKDTAFMFINPIEPQDSVFIPNVFTPNGDNTNDVFFVRAVKIKTLHVEIFNRWGQLVYLWDGPNAGWDGVTAAGQDAPEGTYYYMITGTMKDGTSIPEKYSRGSVTLIRAKN